MDMMKLKKSLKTNKHRFAILLLMVLGWTSCDSFSNDPEKERFDPREHPLIEKGDTLVFIGTENVDSFYVWESQFYLPHERYGDEDYEQYRGRMNLMNYNDTTIKLGILIIDTWYSLDYYFQFRSYSDPELTGVRIINRYGGHEVQIASIVLSEIYNIDFIKHLDELTKDKYSHLFIAVDQAYYSKTYGVVKYIKYTGEEFVLSEESLEMLMARE